MGIFYNSVQTRLLNIISFTRGDNEEKLTLEDFSYIDPKLIVYARNAGKKCYFELKGLLKENGLKEGTWMLPEGGSYWKQIEYYFKHKREIQAYVNEKREDENKHTYTIIESRQGRRCKGPDSCIIIGKTYINFSSSFRENEGIKRYVLLSVDEEKHLCFKMSDEPNRNYYKITTTKTSGNFLHTPATLKKRVEQGIYKCIKRDDWFVSDCILKD